MSIWKNTKYIPHPRPRKERFCKGCGKKIIRNIQGYCSASCFRENDINMYLNGGYYLPQIDKPRTFLRKYGLLYEPVTEDEVLFLFAKVHAKLGYKIIEIMRQRYPDCIALDKNNKKVRIELEYKSKNFQIHNPDKCDVVICWEHDWIECPIKVISLKEIINNRIRIKNTNLLDF